MAKKFLVNLDLNKNQLLNAVIQQLPTDPTNGVAGLIYFNNTDNVLKIHNGTEWIVLSNTLEISSVTGLSSKITELENKDKEISGKITTEIQTLTRSIEEKTRAISSGIGISTVSGLSDKIQSIESTATSNKAELTQAISTEGQRVENIINGKETSIREEIDRKVTKVKSDILGAAEADFDTLEEISRAIKALNSEGGHLTGLTRRFSTQIGDGTAKEYTVTHNLGNRDVCVNLRTSNAPYEQVIADIEFTDENNIKIRTAKPISASEKISVTVIG